MLEFNATGLTREGATLLEQVTLSCPAPGMLWLMGTGGVGKSSLLSALAGLEPDTLQLQGSVRLNEENLQNLVRVHVPQRLQLEDNGQSVISQIIAMRRGIAPKKVLHWLGQLGHGDGRAAANGPASALSAKDRRTLAVLASLEGEGDVWLLDEPTAELDAHQIELVRQALALASTQHSLIIVSHNRQDCLNLGGHVALLAGGTLQEVAPALEFFSNPQTQAARTYVETGNCNLPPPAKPALKDPNGIWWVFPGLLGGMSRPGMIAEADQQYRSLAERGVVVVLNLEEKLFYPADPLRQSNLELRQFPIPDMSAPSFSQAVDICRLAESLINDNRGIVAHCRGGLGRTGTILASILIWYGESAENAIRMVRASEPKAIQSQRQVSFLHDFAERICDWQRSPVPSHLAT